MKKLMIVLIACMVCGSALAGEVGLPIERIALPSVTGQYLVCVWDDSAETWHQAFETYDHSGSYEFHVPSWGKWYWVGLWDQTKSEYVFGKWIGHFITE